MIKVIDGKAISHKILGEIRDKMREIRTKAEKTGHKGPTLSIQPGLGVIIVGDRVDAKTYVRLKRKAANECGFISKTIEFSMDSSQQEIEAAVNQFNVDSEVHGILVQLPLPAHINKYRVLNRISPCKDVDCLVPANLGRLYSGNRHTFNNIAPCTPSGIIRLLQEINFSFEGKHSVVIGRSHIVGIPVSQLLLQYNCTVTVAHSHTKDLPTIVKQADLVIVAIGRPLFVKGDWIKPNSIVIDVGINRIVDPSDSLKYKIVGDCDFDSILPIVSRITPVPGGVGPMTVAMLMHNTFISYCNIYNINPSTLL